MVIQLADNLFSMKWCAWHYLATNGEQSLAMHHWDNPVKCCTYYQILVELEELVSWDFVKATEPEEGGPIYTWAVEVGDVLIYTWAVDVEADAVDAKKDVVIFHLVYDEETV